MEKIRSVEAVVEIAKKKRPAISEAPENRIRKPTSLMLIARVPHGTSICAVFPEWHGIKPFFDILSGGKLRRIRDVVR